MAGYEIGRPAAAASIARRGLAALAAAMAWLGLLAACGGGVGSGGTGTYAAGPITGFGSIIVNGVRYDDSTARVVDDDDVARTRDELRLGMTVEIDGDAIRTDAAGARSATASQVRIGSAIVGPVAAVDLAGGRFTVLGQTVRVAVDTVFDERLAGGLAALAAGQGVEVYGLYDAANLRFEATRIEPRSGLTAGLLRAPVTAVDATARTLRIGNATFAYAAAGDVPTDLAAGRVVRLRLQAAVDSGGRHVVTSFGTGLRSPGDREDGEIEGTITRLTSTTAFEVNGQPVDARQAGFPGGTAGLTLGARVDVRGRWQAGVLVADVVEIETSASVDMRGFEFKGAITSVDAAAKTFVLRGQTVSYARSDLVLDGGTLAQLVAGRKVEVKARPSADRTRLEATRIRFED